MKNKGSTFILGITVMLLSVALTLVALSVFMRVSDYRVVKGPEVSSDADGEDNSISKIQEIDNLIQNSYLKDYDRDAQMEAVYRALLDNLEDPYSRYLSPDELSQLQQDINSSFTGTGIVFIEQETDDNSTAFLITEVITGGPADIAGIKEGDLILKVDGKEIENTESMIEILKGDPGTKVELLILRGDEEQEISVIRGDVTGASVESRTIDGENIGYIKIRSFGDDTASLFDTAISGFETGKVDGLIIDLRDNPGGLFDAGIKVADRILPECMIAYTENKAGEREIFNSDSIGTNLKIAVLINGNTASTAEMVAAAINANGAGTLIGTSTYGKGLIQETHAYDDGSAVNLTTKEFFPGEGIKIDGTGVAPGITVANPSIGNTDAQLARAVEEVKG